MIKNLLAKAVDTLKQYQMIFILLLIYVVTIPVMKTPNLPFLARRIQFSDVPFLFLFFLWVGALIKDKRLPQDTGLNKPFLLFIFFCLLSFLHSSMLFTSIIELLGLIYLFVMLILVVDIVDNRRRLDTIIKVWIGTLVAVMALGLTGWLICLITGESNIFGRPQGVPYFKNYYRALSTFRHPAGLAHYLIISLGFVASDLLLTENKRYKAFLRIVIFFLCLAMFSTLSRGILFFIFSALLIYNRFHETKGLKFRILQFIAISFMIIAFLFITIFCSAFYIRSYKIENLSKENHKELVVNIDYAYDIRLPYKIAALEMVRRHPFLGVGLGMYPSYIKKLNNENYFYSKNLVPIYIYWKSKPFLDYPVAGDPHNDILQYFAETGVFGGGAFILFIITFLYLIYINLRKTDDQYFKVRLFCFLASFIAMLLESIDADVFKARHLWFLMALTLALIMMHKNKIGKIT